MKVLGIGYGRQLFNKENNEVTRLELCADAVASYDQIVFTYDSENFTKTTHSNSLTIHPTNSVSKFTMLLDAYILGKKIIKERNGVDVVTAQDPFETGLISYLLSKRFSIPLNVQEHTDVFSNSYWRKESVLNQIRYLLGTLIVARADTVRVVSERIKNAVVKKFNNESRIRYLPVAVSTKDFSFVERSSSENFTYISVARFVKQKNLMLLIESFAAAYTQNSTLRLILVGKGNQYQNVVDKVHALFPQNSPVALLDWSDDIPGLFKKADAYVLSSNYEGWARVLVEARISGLPVVTTDVGCVGEVIRNGQEGIVVPVNNKNELTKALCKLANDTAFYNQIVENLKLHTDVPGTDMSEYGEKWAGSLV